jgi:hypothetical protein
VSKQTRMNSLQFHLANQTAWKNNPLLDRTLVPKPGNWLGLSHSKLDTMKSYLLSKGQPELLPVWADFDTLILDKTAVGRDRDIGGGRPWVQILLFNVKCD